MILLSRVSFLFNEIPQFPMQWGPVLYTEEQLGLADTIVFGGVDEEVESVWGTYSPLLN